MDKLIGNPTLMITLFVIVALLACAIAFYVRSSAKLNVRLRRNRTNICRMISSIYVRHGRTSLDDVCQALIYLIHASGEEWATTESRYQNALDMLLIHLKFWTKKPYPKFGDFNIYAKPRRVVKDLDFGHSVRDVAEVAKRTFAALLNINADSPRRHDVISFEDTLGAFLALPGKAEFRPISQDTAFTKGYPFIVDDELFIVMSTWVEVSCKVFVQALSLTESKIVYFMLDDEIRLTGFYQLWRPVEQGEYVINYRTPQPTIYSRSSTTHEEYYALNGAIATDSYLEFRSINDTIRVACWPDAACDDWIMFKRNFETILVHKPQA